jgi:glucosyl-3-phosphoglycerate synthase
LAQLGVMARQVVGTALARAGVAGTSAGLTQFVEVMGEWLPDPHEALLADRPPITEVAWVTD